MNMPIPSIKKILLLLWVTVVNCPLTVSVYAQDCTELISFKADQYYMNVQSKPDSIAFINCNYIQKKLSPGEVFIDVFETTMNDVPVFLATLIQKTGAPKVIEIPMPSGEVKQPSATGSNEGKERGIVLPANMYKKALAFCEYRNFTAYIEPHLAGIKKIYYSTSGALNFVNLRFFKNKEGRELFRQYQLVRLHSAASFLGDHQKLALPPKMKMLLVGNLNYDCSKPGGNATADNNQSWTYLPGTRSEIESIISGFANRHSITLLDSCKATEEKVISLVNAGKYDVLHFATHGFYFRESDKQYGIDESSYPLVRSGMVLSGANHPKANLEPFNRGGLFTALDFLEMNTANMGFVVLSTCHSGEGDDYQSAPLGLTLALLRQGINAMMVSNRAVPDQASMLFMKTFYANLAKQPDVDESYLKTIRDLSVAQPSVDWSFFDVIH